MTNFERIKTLDFNQIADEIYKSSSCTNCSIWLYCRQNRTPNNLECKQVIEKWLNDTSEQNPPTHDKIQIKSKGEGKWLIEPDTKIPYCSSCEEYAFYSDDTSYYESDFCPHCGARMTLSTIKTITDEKGNIIS